MNMQQQQQRSTRRPGRGSTSRAAPRLRRAGSSSSSLPSPADADADADAAAASTGSSTTSASSASSSAKKRPSKLRANRERRQRERERSLDEDELEQRFGRVSLSRNAPVFVPASQRSPAAAAATSAPPSDKNVSSTNGSSGRPNAALPTRSLAFVTERNPSKRVSVPPPSRPGRRSPSTGGKPRAKAGNNPKSKSSNSTSEPPRRQRMGAKGFNKSGGNAAQALRHHHRQTRKLSLSAAELDELEARSTPDGDSSSSSSDDANDSSEEDEAFPGAPPTASAFPQKLTLFSQQKHIPQRVASRDEVIDTVFKALFVKPQRRGRERVRASAFGDDTASDSDEPNEEFVKRGLAAALFQDQLAVHAASTLSAETATASPAATADHLLTPQFVHALVNALRFEDFRTASARLDILRAIHKSCPTKRLLLARALADATALRVEFVQAVARRAAQLGVEKSSAAVIAQHNHDHGHGFTELLRYCIEHADESLSGVPAPEGSVLAQQEERQRQELRRNCMASLVALWRAHCVDPAGSDDEELISCAGQFVAYVPAVTQALLQRLLSAWPTRFPKQEVGAVRMVARVIMSGPPLHQVDPTRTLQRRVFTRLARAVQSANVDVAKEALAFTGCQFALVHFLGRDEVVYKAITEALHNNTEQHWHDGVRKTSEAKFDAALDFAP